MDVDDRVNVIRLAAANAGSPTILGEIRGERVCGGIRRRPALPTTLLWVSAVKFTGDAQADLTGMVPIGR
jgi:hypothetical protein